MLEGFQKYLVEQGFKRTKSEYKTGEVEDYESYYISTYGPTEYTFERGDLFFFWGLGVKDYGVYYYYPKEEHLKWVLSGDNEKDLNDIVERKIKKVCLL